MDVKCYLDHRCTHPYNHDKLVKDTRNWGSALLGTYAKETGAVRVGAEGHSFRYGLFVAGGRNSIVQWLRYFGENPLIESRDRGLNLYSGRAQNLFSKNTTLMLITSEELRSELVGSCGWNRPVDLAEFNHSQSINPVELSELVLGLAFRH